MPGSSQSFFASFFSKKEESPLFATLPWHYAPHQIHPTQTLTPPHASYPLGTDALGRDVLSRLLEGGAITLGVALPAAALAFALALLIGLLAAFAPARLAPWLRRLLAAFLALPGLVVLLALAPMLPAGAASLALLIGLVSWPALAAQIWRAAGDLHELPYVLASRQLGASWLWVGMRHVLPALAGFLAINAGLLVADCVLGVSALAFLGLGPPPPASLWGQMLHDGLEMLELRAWWLVLPPGLLIMASVLAARGAGLWLARK